MTSETIQILVAMVIYMAAVIAIGVIFAKRANKNSEEYFLGGRSLGPWVTAMSAEASDMSGWLLMGLPGVAYWCGLADASWTAIGLAVGTYLNWLIVSKRLRRYSIKAGNSITLPEFFSNRFHEKKKVIMTLSALFILIFFTVYAASCFVTCGKLFSTLFGTPYVAMVIIGAVFVLLYTILGGFLAESASDFMQGIVMVVALVAVVGCGVANAGGFGNVVDNAKEKIPGFVEFFNIANPDLQEVTADYKSAEQLEEDKNIIGYRTKTSYSDEALITIENYNELTEEEQDKYQKVTTDDVTIIGYTNKGTGETINSKNLKKFDDVDEEDRTNYEVIYNTTTQTLKHVGYESKNGDFVNTLDKVAEKDRTNYEKVYEPVFNDKKEYGWLSVLSMLAWGLGYFGMPQVLLRFMAIRDEKELPRSRRIAMIWVVISLAVAVFIGIMGRHLYPTIHRTASDAENIFIMLSNSFFPPILAGFVMAGILAATISSSDSYLLIAASALAKNVYQGVINKKASDKEVMWVSRITLVVIALIAMFMAFDENSVIFSIVSFAWAGFGATFGPLMLFSLFWKRTTKEGAIAGMVAGAGMVFLWKLVISTLGGAFAIYELLPAFIFSSIVIVAVSLLTKKPSAEIEEEFEAVKAGR